MKGKRIIFLMMVTVALFATGQMAIASGSTEKGGAASGKGGTLSFWNMPFVTQEVSPDYVKQWLANA
ncbi:hypothetical protein, partial [Salinispira pacifica]